MKIKRLEVNGFRCLIDFKLDFEAGLTLIVGENDAGKTSLIDCLKVVTQNKQIEADDFNHDMNELSISIEIDNYTFMKKYKKDDKLIILESQKAMPTNDYIQTINDTVLCENFDVDDNDSFEYVKRVAKEFGVTVRSNSNIETLRSGIREKLENTDVNGRIIIAGASFPSFNNIQLDGKHFENVPAFFREVFLKEKQASIWHEKVNESMTIEEFVKSKVESYSEEITRKISERGILERMKIFLKDLTEVRIEPVYQSRELNIEAKVKFLENGKETNIDKKGDGTKRRISMALLDFKKTESLLPHDESTIYLLDEPDTHLHVKAQTELLNTVESFADNGDQVILTTHSPFIINSVAPRKIRLIENSLNKSAVKCLRSEISDSDSILKSIGVENIYLFFARHLIIVEGETEENFIPAYFISKFNKTISSALVKIINAKGITNIPGFARAILELHDKKHIYLLYDNDASPDLAELIECLSIPNEQKYIIGNKEFEDSFDSSVLHKCWAAYLLDSAKKIPEAWTVDNIEAIKTECKDGGDKFSKRLKSLNTNSKKMSKPILGKVLGKHVESSELPAGLRELISKIA